MSTVPEGWAEEAEGEGWAGTNEYDRTVVVPVKVMFDENQRVSPEFASCNTWSVPAIGAGTPIQVLQRQYHRYKAKFMVTFPGAGTLYFNTKYEPLSNPSPSGFSVTVAAAITMPLQEYDAMQPVWFIASIPGIQLSVMDELYGRVQ